MSTREDFEHEWGQVDREHGVYFIPELNTYGSDLYAQHEYAQMKSSAWFYFQKGWASSVANADLLSALLAITNSGPDAIPIKEAFEMAHRAIERAMGEKV